MSHINQLQEPPSGKPWERDWVRDWEPAPCPAPPPPEVRVRPAIDPLLRKS